MQEVTHSESGRRAYERPQLVKRDRLSHISGDDSLLISVIGGGGGGG